MGLVLDSGVLIAAEREARPVSELLGILESEHGETEIVLSSITVIELEPGLHRAQTAEQSQKRREYLDAVFAAIPIEPFTREMAQLAAKIDADARTGCTIPFAGARQVVCVNGLVFSLRRRLSGRWKSGNPGFGFPLFHRP